MSLASASASASTAAKSTPFNHSLGKGTRTAIVSGGRKKVHTTYESGDEMIEEFDATTDELLVRRLRYGGPWSDARAVQ